MIFPPSNFPPYRSIRLCPGEISSDGDFAFRDGRPRPRGGCGGSLLLPGGKIMSRGRRDRFFFHTYRNPRSDMTDGARLGRVSRRAHFAVSGQTTIYRRRRIVRRERRIRKKKKWLFRALELNAKRKKNGHFHSTRTEKRKKIPTTRVLGKTVTRYPKRYRFGR